jgi:hypothetical protein
MSRSPGLAYTDRRGFLRLTGAARPGARLPGPGAMLSARLL